jgi:hypothetical protein
MAISLMKRYVYILHFDKPFKHAKHYVGSADCVRDRLFVHESAACDVKILQAAKTQGITWSLAKVMKNDLKNGHTKEFRIKRSGGIPKQGLCPICQKQEGAKAA